jgi:predicted SAM-dependent methyltransferase
MNTVLFDRGPAGTAAALRREFLPDTEVTVEALSKAVGENALLHAEVNRQMALRILQMREDIRAGQTEIQSLRTQVDDLIHGFTQAFALARDEWRHATQATHASHSAPSKAPVVPRLLSPEKLLKVGASMRLNIGCGAKPLADYVNVDERELEGVDLVADVRSLPFRAETLSEIYAAHLIEHFTEPDFKSTVLPAWRSLLKAGGFLHVVTPDAEGMIRAFSRGEYSFENLRTVTYGGQDYPGNFHYTMFSREGLLAILREAGFTVGEYIALARPNGLCLEMELKAVKRS